jgi:hypothetical protein
VVEHGGYPGRGAIPRVGDLHRKPDAMFLAKMGTPLYLRLLAFAVPVLFLTTIIRLCVWLAAAMDLLGGVGFVLAFCGSGLGAAGGIEHGSSHT